jgi:hypothetical protein
MDAGELRWSCELARTTMAIPSTLPVSRSAIIWKMNGVRAILVGADDRFVSSDGDRLESRISWGVSVDQEFGDRVGGFLRFSWQQDDAEGLYGAHYSAGIEIKGQSWGREHDRIGIGLANLEGGNSIAKRTRTFEAYYRVLITNNLEITGDVQYMNDKNRQGSSPSGWVFGVRTTLGLW